MPAGVSRRIIGAALVTALLLAGLVTARLQPNHMADVAAALEAIRHLGRVGWMASFFIQTFVAASGILPASLVGIAAGAIYGPVLGFLLAAAAILVGATLAFLLSRSLFRPLIANLLERQAKLRNFDALIADEGWKFVCLMRVSPIMPFAATSYVLGLSSILFQDYLVGSLAALPALMGYVVIGTLADASLAAWHTGAGKIRLALLVLGAVATVVLASKIARIAIRAGLGLDLDAMPTLAKSEALTFQKLSDNGQIMSLDTRFNATDDSRGPELTRTASRPFAPFPAVFPAVSQQRAIQVMAAFAGLTWVAGFLLGEDTSGGAQYDFLNSHWAGSKLFADRPFLPVLRDYPTATMPLQHLLMAQLPWVHDPFAYRLTGFAIGTSALVMFGIAVHHRFALVWRNPNLPLLAAAAVALSPGLRSAAFWGNTDALPLLLMALTVLMLYDGRTGNWRKSASLGLVIVVALTTAAAFYTRQFYAFLAIFCFWLLASRTQFSRPLLCLVFGITAIPALFLVWLWHGLTPPCCQSKPALTNVVYAGALAAPFALPFLFTRPPLGRPSTRAWIGLGAIATALFLIFHGMNLTPLGGGLITKFGLLLGPAGVPVVLACAALGWWAIGMLLASGLDNAILFGLAIFPLLLPDVRFQRYLDPLAFTLVLLLASPPLARRLVTERSIFAGYFFFLGLELIGLTWFMILGHKLL